jgi:capsular polysaccharide transport system permease protein
MMKLRTLARRALIFVGTDHQVPAARPADAMLVGTGTRLVPTIYEELRLQRRRRMLAMAVSIALPTVIAALYYWLIATDRYVSDTQMVVSDQAGPGAAGGAGGKSSLLSLIGMTGNDSQTTEIAIVTNYLNSSQALDAADKVIGLRRMWGAPSIDYFSRLPANASLEDFHKYYRRHVTLVADPTEPVIQVRVEAFNPKDAQVIGKTLVGLAQEKLNSAFVGMREDALQFARSEVSRAEQQLASVNDKLRSFRHAHSEMDPGESAKGVGSVTLGMFAQLANTEAELRTTLAYAREDSATVKNLRSRIAALRKQISENRGLLAGDQQDKPYADLLASYEGLVLEQKFAQESYTSAMGFLASSRASLAHQHAYLIDFISPTLPEEATEPRSSRNVLVVFIASVLLWLTGSLVASALREHARR